MRDLYTDYGYEFGDKREEALLPCWNCGNLVPVTLPFLGCVYCSKCTSSNAGTEDLQWDSRPQETHNRNALRCTE